MHQLQAFLAILALPVQEIQYKKRFKLGARTKPTGQDPSLLIPVFAPLQPFAVIVLWLAMEAGTRDSIEACVSKCLPGAQFSDYHYPPEFDGDGD